MCGHDLAILNPSFGKNLESLDPSVGQDLACQNTSRGNDLASLNWIPVQDVQVSVHVIAKTWPVLMQVSAKI